jgi:predicted RNA binding protein YcfA (HicA-like mRNA interferase family)
VSGTELIRLLGSIGYQVVRQTGSHIRLRSTIDTEHSITIPNHDSLKVGTFNAILVDVALHLGITKQELIQRLFG